MCDCLNCSDITIPQGSQGPTGPQGATGANGTNGTDGVGVLINTIFEDSTSGTVAWETLKTHTISANELSTSESKIEILARFTVDESKGQQCRIQFNGSTIVALTFQSGVDTIDLKVSLTRYGNTIAKVTSKADRYQGIIAQPSLLVPLSNITGLNFTTNPYVINADGHGITVSAVDYNVNSEILEITKYIR